MSALEIGDGKADVSAEWLAQLCGALYAHPSLRRLTLRKMMVNSLPKGGAEAGLQALSYALRDTRVLEVLQLQSCGLESKHIVPLCVELKQASAPSPPRGALCPRGSMLTPVHVADTGAAEGTRSLRQ